MNQNRREQNKSALFHACLTICHAVASLPPVLRALGIPRAQRAVAGKLLRVWVCQRDKGESAAAWHRMVIPTDVIPHFPPTKTVVCQTNDTSKAHLLNIWSHCWILPSQMCFQTHKFWNSLKKTECTTRGLLIQLVTQSYVWKTHKILLCAFYTLTKNSWRNPEECTCRIIFPINGTLQSAC